MPKISKENVAVRFLLRMGTCVVVFYFAFSCAKFDSLKLSLRKRINIYKVCLLAAYPPVANLTFLPAVARYFARKELGAAAGYCRPS